MSEELVKLERKVQGIYEKAVLPSAKRLVFDLPISEKEAVGLPSVLFLGNHSSGKSTFINYLAGETIQKTGLAPTDDGFTVITYGEKADEFDGQTVVTHQDLSYGHLERLGPAFLNRLRLKTRPLELLRSIALIDSPGMIDAAGTANTRGYDFSAGVRYFAERADLILFFFDPDKPGTTGETVSTFTETLTGLEYKLLIVLNKVDLFQNIRDFARTFGTLCWNLSKTIKTKDIPHIFNVYLPSDSENGPQASEHRVIPLADFEQSRREVVEEIKRTPTRRADNLVSDLYNHARKVLLHGRVSEQAVGDYRSWRNRLWGSVAGVALVTGLLVWLTRNAESVQTPITIGLLGILLAGLMGGGVFYFLQRFRQKLATPEGLEPYFQRAYRQELSVHERPDLRALWHAVKGQSLNLMNLYGPDKAPFSYTTRRMLRRLEEVIEEEIPKLRREIASYHSKRQRPLVQPEQLPEEDV